MGNETKINPFARILNAVTKVNPNVASQKEEMASQTVVNSELAQAHEIEAQVQEQLLLGKYSVVKPLDVVSGVVCSKRLLNQAVGKSLRTHKHRCTRGTNKIK